MLKGPEIKKNLLPLSFLIFKALWAVTCGSVKEGIWPSLFIYLNFNGKIKEFKVNC